MGKLAKPANRLLFALCVLITGAIAGAFVWAFFFCMDIGLGLLWEKLPQTLGAAAGREVPALASGPFGFAAWPLIVCLIGGLAIGLYDKHVGFAPEELNVVMGKVKGEGRYPYDHLGKRSLSALLPLLFGGSVGPEAGLTGVIAGLCTWVGDRMRRFGADFRAMTVAGTQAALTALFTAPLYGFAAPLAGTADGRVGGDGLREGGAHARVHQAWLARRPFLPGHLLGNRAWLRLCPDQRRRCGVLRCRMHLGAHGRGHAPAAHGGASAGHVLPAQGRDRDAGRGRHRRGHPSAAGVEPAKDGGCARR